MTELESFEMFKALAVETRVKILDLLKAQGPLGAKEIGKLLGITPAAASQHLKILRQAGLVRSERKGYWIPYSINVEALEKYRLKLNQVCTCGCQGTGNWKEQESDKAGVEALKKYAKDLQQELKVIRERIKEIESK
jgi:ArsR family transcriptional regulator, arsenate/arsenite/antimonite-responsive transcriptional repressor